MSWNLREPQSDARLALWLQLAAQSLYIACGFRLLGLQRSGWSWAGVVAAGALTDWALSCRRERGWARRFPLSGLIAGSSVFLFLESRSLLVYVVAGAVAAASKHLLAWNGRHVFNPGNFGVLFMVLLFPRHASTTNGLWASDTGFLLAIAACGGMVAWLARRWAVACGYFIAFAAGFALFAGAMRLRPAGPWDAGIPPLLGLGLNLSPFMLIYTLHMITDPRTTPQTTGRQFAFGAAVAAGALVLARASVLHATHHALAWVCVLRHLWIVRRELSEPQGLSMRRGTVSA